MKYLFLMFLSFNLFGASHNISNKTNKQIEKIIFEKTHVSYSGANSKKIIQGKFTLIIKDPKNAKALYKEIIGFCEKEKIECFLSQDYKNKFQMNMRAFSNDPSFKKLNSFLKNK